MYYRQNNKSVAAIIILSIVTCGIYYFIWIAETTNMLREQNRRTRMDNYYYEDFDMSGGMVVLLSFVTCGLFTIYWWYKVGRVFQNIQIREGLPMVADNSMIYLLLAVFQFSIVGMGILQSEMNAFWDYLDHRADYGY